MMKGFGAGGEETVLGDEGSKLPEIRRKWWAAAAFLRRPGTRLNLHLRWAERAALTGWFSSA